MVWGAKKQKFSRGDPFPSQGGLLPPIFQFFLFLAKYLKLYIFWISSTWCVLWAKKILRKFCPGGAQPPIYVKSFVRNRLGLCNLLYKEESVCLCVCVSVRFWFLSMAHCVSICVPKTIYFLNQQHLVCLMIKKNIEKIWPRGGSAPHLREILCPR